MVGTSPMWKGRKGGQGKPRFRQKREKNQSGPAESSLGRTRDQLAKARKQGKVLGGEGSGLGLGKTGSDTGSLDTFGEGFEPSHGSRDVGKESVKKKSDSLFGEVEDERVIHLRFGKD